MGAGVACYGLTGDPATGRPMKRRRKSPETEIRACPKCGSLDVRRWLYGELAGEAPPGYIPGGCLIGLDSPHWHCEECGHDWGRAPT